MVQIDINKWIVYNNDGLLIFMEAYSNEDKSIENDNIILFRTYLNDKNLSEDYIKTNLKKSLSLKDKIVAAYKKSPFHRTFTGERVIAGEIIKPIYIQNEILASKADEITNMIKSVLTQGKLVANLDMTNGFRVEGCSLDEMTGFFNGFESLQNKHSNTPSKKGR